MLPNLPNLKNSTHFAWKSYLKKPKSLLSCTHRPKLVDIKEGFVFEVISFHKFKDFNTSIFIKTIMYKTFSQFNNKFWQVHESNFSRFYLFGAYLDIREKNIVPSVRINGLIERDEVTNCLEYKFLEHLF